jgi:hypothetical protein
MVIDALTPGELATHERAIVKIRQKLFARHTSEEYGIVDGSEEVMPACAQNRWNAGVGNYRLITCGGLRFDFSGPRSRFTLTVMHFERDVFTVHISNGKGHTEMVDHAKFDSLDQFVWKHVENCRRRDASSSRRT